MPALWRRISFAAALAAGVGFSQAPEYAQQYRQRLGGAIDELQAVIDAFDADSQGLGLTHDQGVARLEGDEDAFVRQRGDRIQQETARLGRLKKQNASLNSDLPLARVFGLTFNFDSSIARAAFSDYKPALPLTADGAASAAVGFAIVLLLLRLASAPLSWRKRRRGAVQR